MVERPDVASIASGKPATSTTFYCERTWVSRDGLKLFARDYPPAAGAARLPVVCLHGLTRNSADFEDVAPVIASLGRRVIVPDMRGRGRSAHDPRPSNYQIRTYVTDILALLDDLGIKRAVFVGTSMGGLITLAMAFKRRSAVAAAVLNDVGPEVSPSGIQRILSYAGQSVPIKSWDDAVAQVRRINVAAFPLYTDADWRTMARRSFIDLPGEAPKPAYDSAIAINLAKASTRLSSTLAWLALRRLGTSSLLLVRGALSDLMTADIAAKMRRIVRHMDVTAVPDVGHAPMLSEPAARDALSRFFARVP